MFVTVCLCVCVWVYTLSLVCVGGYGCSKTGDKVRGLMEERQRERNLALVSSCVGESVRV